MSSKTLSEMRQEAERRGVSLAQVVKEYAKRETPVNRLDVER